MASFDRSFVRSLPLGVQAAQFDLTLRQRQAVQAQQEQARQEKQAQEQRKQALAIMLKGQELAAKGQTKAAKLMVEQFAFPKMEDVDDSFKKAFLGSLGAQAEDAAAIAQALRGIDTTRSMGEQIVQMKKGDASPLLNMLDSTLPQGAAAIQTSTQPSPTASAAPGPAAPGFAPPQPGSQAPQQALGRPAVPQALPPPGGAPVSVQALQAQRDQLQAAVARLESVAATGNKATKEGVKGHISDLNTKIAQTDRQISQVLDIGRESRAGRAEARGELRQVQGRGLIRIRPGQAPELLVPSLNQRQVLQSDIRRLQALGDKATPGEKRELERNLEREKSLAATVGRTESDMKAEAEARQEAAGSIDTLGSLGIVLKDVERVPFAVGFRGSLASAISGFLKQIPGMSLTAEGVSQYVAQGSIKEVQAIRTNLISQIGKQIKTILADTSGRYSDRDVALVKEAQGALKPTASEETIRGAIQSLTVSELMGRQRGLSRGGLPPDFDLNIDDDQRRLARVLGTMGFSRDEALKIREDLLLIQRLERQISGER